MTTLNEASSIVSFSENGADIDGAYVELIASAARDTNWALLYIAGDVGWSFRTKIDIAIGGAGSEVDRIKDFSLIYTSTGSNFTDSFNSVSIPLKVTAGDRVSIRIQGQGGTGNYRGQIRLFAL